ncbi:lysophospholipid acyltransferase family protein [Saccharopolyspora sp. NPDC002578]
MAEPASLKRSRKRTKERPPTLMGRFWLRLAAVVFYPLTALLSRVRVHGLENIPATGPALLVLNHVSHLDPLYDAVTVHRAARVPRFMAKNTLWNVPVLRNVLNGVEQIPVFRQTADARKSLEAAHDALEAGKIVIIYPDGTVTKDPEGWPMSPKPGVARLAVEHDVPIVPAARWGTRDVYDHYEKKFRPFPRKTVHVRIGEPLDLSEYRDAPADAPVLRTVSELAMSRVRELLGDIREQQPPGEFYSAARRRDQQTRSDDDRS